MNPPDLEALADAVEKAYYGDPLRDGVFHARLEAWLAARRAAREAGLRIVLVSEEAITALRAAQGNGDTVRACELLARDLAAVLKETP